jgi:hypothetical protein
MGLQGFAVPNDEIGQIAFAQRLAKIGQDFGQYLSFESRASPGCNGFRPLALSDKDMRSEDDPRS